MTVPGGFGQCRYQGRHNLRGRRLQKIADLGFSAEQPFDAPTQLDVARADLIEVGGPLLLVRALERGRVNLIDGWVHVIDS
jgi:hypothetical protein